MVEKNGKDGSWWYKFQSGFDGERINFKNQDLGKVTDVITTLIQK